MNTATLNRSHGLLKVTATACMAMLSSLAGAQNLSCGATQALLPNEVPGSVIPAGQIAAAVARVDGLARKLMTSSGIPGMAVAVVVDGKTVFARGYGQRRLGVNDRVDADTVFLLASMSKPIGATVIAEQVGKGVISWDTPLQKLLPEFQLADPYVSSHVTVGDMYAHRSGLPDHAGDLLEDLGYDRELMQYRLRYMPLAPFRAVYAYTNMGLTAGAQAVAVASGSDWASLSEKAIYQPLGMASTSSRYEDFMRRTNKSTAHIKAAGAYRVSPLQPHPDAQSPAGGVSSSVNDVARWMSMVLAQGCVGSQPVVDRDALRAVLSPHVVSAPPATPQARSGFYGYGINVADSAAGRVTLTHSGAFNLGAATAFTMIPSARVGIVTLTNAQPSGVPETLNAEFSDLVQFGKITQNWGSLYAGAFAPMLSPQGSLLGKRPPAELTPAKPVADYVGSYENTFYGPAKITANGDKLTVTLGPAGIQLPLTHWNGDVFTLAPPGESQSAGSISAVSFDKGALTIEYLDDEHLGTFCRADAKDCKR